MELSNSNEINERLAKENARKDIIIYLLKLRLKNAHNIEFPEDLIFEIQEDIEKINLK